MASSSPELPQTAIPRSIKVAEECSRALWSLDREYYEEALLLLKFTLSRHSASPLIDAARSLVYYKMASQICDSTSTRLEYLMKALESSRQAAALAPTSTSCALFHALALLRLGLHAAALQECERGVKIERPVDPGSTRRILTEREMTIRQRLWELKEKLHLKIIVLESGKGRGKWKRLLDDNSLAEAKNEIETLHQIKKRIVEARSEDFLKEKKVDMIEKWNAIWRVKPFWTGMRVDRKKALLKIGIQELKAHLAKNNTAEMDLAREFLQEALDFAKKARKWRFWICFCCGDRFRIDTSFLSHLKDEHLGTFSRHFLSIFPLKAWEPVLKRLEDGVWKPVESSWPAKIMKVDSNILLHCESWLFCDDSNREGLIEEIRAKLVLFIRSKCLALSHFKFLRPLIKDSLRNHIPEQEKIDQMFSMNEFRSVCFLEVPELKRVLKFLEDLASACAFPCIAETLPDDQHFYRDVRDRVIFNREFSDILLNERLLLTETTDLKDDANAVGDSSTCVTDLDPHGDAFLYWLWERDPPIPERLQTWASVREADRSRGLELYKILEAEFHRLKKLLEMKLEFSRYNKAFEEVEKMYLKARNRRLEGFPEDYLDILVKRWTDIQADREAVEDVRSFELDIIWSILEVTQGGTEIETEFQRQRQRRDQQLLLLDLLILATDAVLSPTYEALEKLCTYDYRFIVVPMLRSFIKKRLEDLVEESEHLRPGKSLKTTCSEEHHPPGKETGSSEEHHPPGEKASSEEHHPPGEKAGSSEHHSLGNSEKACVPVVPPKDLQKRWRAKTEKRPKS